MLTTKRTGRLPLSIAEQGVLLYATVTYLPQFFLHIFADDALRERFLFAPRSQALAAFIPLFFILVYLLQRLLPRFELRAGWYARLICRIFESRLNLLVGLITVALGINFSITEGLSFRQSGDRLSDAGLLVAALVLSKPYMYSWLVYHYLLVMRGRFHNNQRARVHAALFLVALISSVTGSLDVLPVLWMAAFTVTDAKGIYEVFTVAGLRRSFLVKASLLLVGVPVAATTVVVIIAIGWVNKLGLEGSGQLLERVGVGWIASQTVVRTSSSYAAVIAFADHNLANMALYEQVAKLPVENVPYRLSLIVGDPLPRPAITQLARLNYLNYEEDTSLERAGASPGLVGSAFYAGPFPLGFLLIALYTVVISRIANLPFGNSSIRPRITAVIFIASFIYPLFETPIDYLIFIDPAIAQLILVLSAFYGASTRSGATNPTPQPTAATRTATRLASTAPHT